MPGMPSWGSRLRAGSHPRQDSWVDDSDTAPLLSTLVALQRQQETAYVLKKGMSTSMCASPAPCYPLHLSFLPASFLRTSGDGLEPGLQMASMHK